MLLIRYGHRAGRAIATFLAKLFVLHYVGNRLRSIVDGIFVHMGGRLRQLGSVILTFIALEIVTLALSAVARFIATAISSGGSATRRGNEMSQDRLSRTYSLPFLKARGQQMTDATETSTL